MRFNSMGRSYGRPPRFTPRSKARVPISPDVAQVAGVAWDSDAINLIAAGDQDEAQGTYGDVDGYAGLNKVRGGLFEEQ